MKQHFDDKTVKQVWQDLDANKDGLLTKVEVAEMFGVGHLLLLPADEQQALLASLGRRGGCGVGPEGSTTWTCSNSRSVCLSSTRRS